jgi:hypothetical protein
MLISYCHANEVLENCIDQLDPDFRNICTDFLKLDFYEILQDLLYYYIAI